ncbi:MAG: isoprenylcysteine carboxylmethyltransferase family protein [Planctomycetia bacterium]|nr:isoprenylcysteine carboxylmethyltransferase family protein [Planctomycetia bacterium]
MDIRQFFFKNRSYTPIPLVLLLLFFSNPYQPVIYLGFILLTLGELCRVWAVSYAGGRTRTTKVGAPKLCTSGPFAYVRNPLYLGNMIIYSGVVLIAGGPQVLLMLGITLLFFIIQYLLIVSLEQETLTNLFGKEYLTYCENVPALIPRLTAWKDGVIQEPLGFDKVFKPEKNTFLNILLILILIFIRSQIPSV